MKKIRFKGKEYPIFPFSSLRLLFDKGNTEYSATNVQDALVETDDRLKELDNSKVDTTDSRLSDSRNPLPHNHDDRYYTESEINTKLNSKLNSSLKGSKNGLAELDANGMVPSNQLPSFVDDVLEGTAVNPTFDEQTNAVSATGFILKGKTEACTPENGKIYLDISTNIQYRWSGSIFISTGSFLALGETSSTAYRGDRGKTAYEHSQATHAPSNAQANVIESVKVNGTALTPSSKAVNIPVFTKSGSTAAVGLVPKPSTTAGTTKYLREDCTWGTPPNTHYASGTIVNNSATATANTTAALTNGNVYLNHVENGSVKNSHKISGSGATTVTSDASGNITVTTPSDTKASTVSFTTSDVADGSATSWTSVSQLTTGITHATFFQRVSQMFKNVRYLYKMLGTTDISSIGDGTCTGAINSLNSNFDKISVISPEILNPAHAPQKTMPFGSVGLNPGIYYICGSAKHSTNGGNCVIGISTSIDMLGNNGQLIHGNVGYDGNKGSVSTIMKLTSYTIVYFLVWAESDFEITPTEFKALKII